MSTMLVTLAIASARALAPSTSIMHAHAVRHATRTVHNRRPTTPSRVPRPPRASATATASSTAHPAAPPVLDERLVVEQPQLVTDALERRYADASLVHAVGRVGELTLTRARLVEAGNEQRSVRKSTSTQIGALLKSGDKDGAEAAKVTVAAATAEADRLDAELERVDEERDRLFAQLPNLLDARTPPGEDESANIAVSSWGFDDIGSLPSGGAWHDETAAALGGLDTEAASKLSGSRFAVLRGSLARLERALISYFLDLHAGEHGYTELQVPLIVGASALRGTGQLPKFEEDLFKLSEPLNGREAYLIPTGEVPLTNLHAGEILDEASLPISYVAHTPCFRAEAGSAGKDTRGLFRQHQFNKVELVKICRPSESDAEHERLVAHAEACLRALKLPYRKMMLCGGDIGFSAALCYDLEVWLPGQGRFREISSCSNCGSFQARRMNLRYRPVDDGSGKKQKPHFCHTINGSGLAVGRTVVAILENYLNDDGSVTVPDVLRPYMGGLEKMAAPGAA